MGDEEIDCFSKEKQSTSYHDVDEYPSRGVGPYGATPRGILCVAYPVTLPYGEGMGGEGGKGGHPHRDTMLIFLIKKSASVSPHTPLYIKGV